MVKIFNFENDAKEFSSNTYVIGKISHDCIVIDLGSTSDVIYDYVSSHYEKVAAILLTHAHFDHIRGLTNFLKHYKNKYDIPVYLASDDKELLNNPDLNASKVNGEIVQINTPVIELNQEKTINIKEFTIKVFYTPFHTEGSVCYLFEDDNALFTGDTLFAGSIGRSDLMTSDSNKIKSSLLKLYNLNNNLVVYPGHGPITRLEKEKKTNPFFSNIDGLQKNS